jgi:LCP family protein required for cell wall assembly
MGSTDDFLPRPGNTGGLPAVSAPETPTGRRSWTRRGSHAKTAPPKAARASKPPRQPKPAKPHRWLKRSAIGLGALVVIGLMLGGAAWFYVNYRIDEIPTVHVKHLVHVKPGAPMNILLIGSDSRVGIPPDETIHYGGTAGPNAVTGQRSDVIIILRVIPALHKLEMLSIPRDTWANIVGTGLTEKINGALNYGPSELINSIETDFGIPINHFVYTTFPGFTDAVQTLGGVYLSFPDKLKDLVTGLRINKTGCQLLNGFNALALVRSRDLQYYTDGQWNYDGLGDLSRIRRQEQFFYSVIERAQSQRFNFVTINAFIGNIVHDITIDSTFSKSDLISLAEEFYNVPPTALRTQILPTQGAVIDESDVLLPAWRYDVAMIHDFLAVGAPTSTTTTSTTAPATTTTTTQPQVTGTTTPVIFDNNKNYPEPWNPVPCKG